MTRRHFAFDCEGNRLVGTLDDAAGNVGLLLVTGGNELRSGAWSGQAQFASRIAAAGHPVCRFDRRGVGDSEGANQEFRSSAPDITAAIEAFRRECPQLTHIVGLGNCDAASALMLLPGAGLDAMILSNPWTFDSGDAAPVPSTVRAHYRDRLADPAAFKRLLTGQVSLRRLASSLIGALRPAPAPTPLAQEMSKGIAAFGGPVRFLIAERDRTGQAFLSSWRKADPRLRICPDASHSYVEAHAREWLIEQTLEMLRT